MERELREIGEVRLLAIPNTFTTTALTTQMRQQIAEPNRLLVERRRDTRKDAPKKNGKAGNEMGEAGQSTDEPLREGVMGKI